MHRPTMHQYEYETISDKLLSQRLTQKRVVMKNLTFPLLINTESFRKQGEPL